MRDTLRKIWLASSHKAIFESFFTCSVIIVSHGRQRRNPRTAANRATRCPILPTQKEGPQFRVLVSLPQRQQSESARVPGQRHRLLLRVPERRRHFRILPEDRGRG